MNLSNKDIQLLSYLHHNSREPLTKIARATKLSREQVEYRLNKLLSLGIIKKFYPAISYPKLGYPLFCILLLKFSSLERSRSFEKQYKRQSSCIGYGKPLSEYDYFITLIFKDEKDRNSYLSQLLEDFQDSIQDYSALTPFHAEVYPLKFLGNKTLESYTLISFEEESKLSEKERKLLQILSNNARIKLTDIADKLNISAELALYTLRKLQKQKILLGSRIEFDMKKLGYFYSLILINLSNFSEKNQQKLNSFAKNHPHVDSLGLMFTKPNCFMQVFHKDEHELRKTLSDLKEVFKSESLNLKVIPLENGSEPINPLPFL